MSALGVIDYGQAIDARIKISEVIGRLEYLRWHPGAVEAVCAAATLDLQEARRLLGAADEEGE